MSRLDQSINQFLNNHSLSIDSFDDVLISGGLANCNYVYNYIQEKFPNCVSMRVSNDNRGSISLS